MTTKQTLFLPLLLASAACAPDMSSDKRSTKDSKPELPADGTRSIDVARPAFQAKSSAQLTRSVEACVGKGALGVTAAMVITEGNTNGFLTSDFVAGSNIVTSQALLFDGTPEALRTGVRVDQISLEYITALKNVANVVGAHCVAGDAELCSCDTDDAAKAMIARCLAGVADPSAPAFAELAHEMSVKCQSTKGGAIASMIASLAFAKVP